MIEFLQAQGLVQTKPIKDIDNLGDGDIEVICYDNFLRKKVETKISMPSLACVDALLPDYQNNTLYFIEIKADVEKSIEVQKNELKSKYLQYDFDTVYHESIKLQNELDKHIDNLADKNYADKIIDSYMLLLAVLGYCGADKALYSCYLDKTKIKIKYIVLVKLSSKNFSKFKTSNLPKIKNNLNFRFLTDSSVVNVDAFINQFKSFPPCQNT